MTDQAFTVRAADWKADAPLLRPIRQAVFIDEQRVPEELEWDELDIHCLHALALDTSGTPIGCGRLTTDGKIGRMAVLAPWRKAGVGGAILRFLIDEARRRGATECRLDAQIEAVDFYHRHGFIAEGDEFLDANIRHRRMRLTLPGRREIDSLAACRDAVTAVAAVARFDLTIFTHDL
ncbi:MAG TPA: GNAT family N-acetyltransferase, partial [Gammaproteobacteria bacterium]|nr:GNAT family N-acetyltransferase [Gammaproteobacteria bacterium]